MSIYLVSRVKPADYGQVESCVIIAENESDALLQSGRSFPNNPVRSVKRLGTADGLICVQGEVILQTVYL